jgi:cell division transport system permease protein
VRGQLLYLVSEAFRGLRQHRTVILPSLVTLFLCSFLLMASLSVLLAAGRLLSGRDALYTVDVFLERTPVPTAKDSLQRLFMSIKRVESVDYISPDSALADFSARFSSDMLTLVEGNPLPASFRLHMFSKYQNPEDLRGLLAEVERLGQFAQVQAPLEWAERLETSRFDLLFWPLFISLLMLLTLGLIIGNAVRLTLFSRQLLVENMKYAGGTVFFIQFPFVLEGTLQGLLGSSAAALLCMVLSWSLFDQAPMLRDYLTGLSGVMVGVVALVTAIGAYSSYRAVRSFLVRPC